MASPLDAEFDALPDAPAQDEFDSFPDAPADAFDAFPDAPNPEDEEDRKDEFLFSLHKAVRAKPDEYARTLEISRRIGAEPSLVERDRPKWEETLDVAEFDPRAWRKNNPELAAIAFEQPALGPLVTRDDKLPEFLRDWNEASKQLLRENIEFWRKEVEKERADPGFLDKFFGEFLGFQSAAEEALADAEKRLKRLDEKPEPKLQDPSATLTGLERYTGVIHATETVGGEDMPAIDAPADTGTLRVERPGIFQAAFQQGQRHVELALLGDRLIGQLRAGNREAAYETEKRILEVQREAMPRDYGQGFLEDLVVRNLELLPAQLEVGKEALPAHLLGFGISAAATRFLGPGGARAGQLVHRILTGGAVAHGTFVLERGSAFVEFRGLATDDGAPVSDEEAMGAANLHGFIAAGLEAGTLGPFLKMFGRLGDAAAAGNGKALMKRLMRDRGFRSLVADAGRRYASGMGWEALTESMQQVSNELGAYLARTAAANPQLFDEAVGGEGMPAVDAPLTRENEFRVQSIDMEGATARVAQAGVDTLLGMQGQGAVGVSVSLTTDLVMAQAAKRESLRLQALLKVAESPTAQAAPEVVARLVEAQTAAEGEPVTHVYVDGAAMQRLFQDAAPEEVERDVAELLGPEGPQKLTEAVATAGKVEIPVADYISKVATKDVAKALLNDTAFRADGITVNEASRLDLTEVKKQSDELAKRWGDAPPAPESGGESEFVSAWENEAREVLGDKFDPQVAAKSVIPLRAAIRTLAARSGKSADELFRMYAISVQDSARPGRQRVAGIDASTLTPEAKAKLEELERAKFRDNLTPLGNKTAFEDFRSRDRKGVHLALDINDFKAINEAVGHDVADRDVLTPLGTIIHELAGAHRGKGFRTGGDEFRLHFDSREQARAFVEQLTARVAQMPAVGGQKVSFSAGLAGAAERADVVANTAKEQKRAKHGDGRAGGTVGHGESFVAWDEAGIEDIPADTRLEQDPKPGDAGYRRPAHELVDLDVPIHEPPADLVAEIDALPRATNHPNEPNKTKLKHWLANTFARTPGTTEPRTYTNKDQGWSIVVSASGAGESSNWASGASIPALAALPKLLEDAIYIESEAHDPADRNIPAVHVLFAAVRVNDVVMPVRIRVKKTNAGDRFYQLHAIEQAAPGMEERPTPTTDRGEDVSVPLAASETPGTIKVGKLLENVKRDEAGTPLLNIEQAGDGEGPRGFVEFSPMRAGVERLFRIVLTGKADRTTFLHESAHVFFELFADVAERPDAPQQMKDDFATALKWMGVADRAELGRRSAEAAAIQALAEKEGRKLTAAEKRQANALVEPFEKFARGFETYLFEGKAPSFDLAGVFESFKLWLKQVYRELKNLNAPLTDEVRGVFDRLLATDDEIAMVKRAMGLTEPLFRSAEEAGLTPAQYSEYLGVRAEATSTVARKAELRALKDRLRSTESWWNEQREAVREEVEGDYELLPGVRAANYLQRGVLRWRSSEGVIRESSHGGPKKLDRTAVLAMLELVDAPKWLKPFVRTVKTASRRRASGMTAAEVRAAAEEAELDKALGTSDIPEVLHPDDAAEFLELGSGRELLEALQQRPDRSTWVEQQVESRMAERFPDVLQDRTTLAAEVQKGLHGHATMDVLLREFRIITKRAVSPVELAAADRAADAFVETMPVRTLNGNVWTQRERALARSVTEAIARGNVEQAEVLQLQRIYALKVGERIIGAAEERESFLDLAADLRKDKARARFGKADPLYRDAVDVVLETVGLKEPERREQPFAGVDALVTRMEQFAETIAFDPEQLAAVLAKPRDYRELSVAELRNLVAALKNVRQAARNRNGVLVDLKRIDKDLVVRELAAEAERNLPLKGAVSSSVPAASVAQLTKSGAATVDAWLLQMETVIVSFLGGGDTNSMWSRAVLRPLQDAKRRSTELMQSVAKPIIEALQAVPPEVRNRWFEKVDGKALFPSHRADIEAPTRRFELFMMALNRGNASNLQRLTQGRGIAEAELDAALEVLTKQEWDAISTIGRTLESLWPEIRALEEKDSGLPPEKIAPIPIPTKFGVIPGFYFPAVYEKRVTTAGEKQAAQTLADLMDPSYTRPGTSHGHTRSRVEDFADALALDPSILPAHLAQVIHDLAYRQAIKSVGSLIIDPRVQKTLREHLGHERAQQFLQWLKDVGQAHGAVIASHGNVASRVFGRLRSNAAVNALGYALRIALGDASNLEVALAATKLKSKYLLAGMAEALNGTHGWPWGASDFARQKSGELNTRWDRTTRKLDLETRRLARRNFKGVRRPVDWMREHAFDFFEWTEKATLTPIWIGSYRQALDEGMSEADAVAFADNVARKVVPAMHVLDKARVQRDRLTAPLLMFYGYANVTYQRNREIAHMAYLAHAEGDTAAQRWLSVGRIAPRVTSRALALWFGYGVLAEFLSGRGPEEDDGDNTLERFATWSARKMVLAPFYSLPFVGGVVESWALGKRASVRAMPQFELLEGALKTLSLLGKEELSRKDLENVARVVGAATGLPANQAVRTIGYLFDFGSGESEVRRDPAGFVGGVIYGERDGQSMNPASVVSDAASGTTR